DTTSTQVYDIAEPLPLVIEDGATAYLTGPDGLPVERIAADGATSYYSHDQLGSTTALTNGDGQTLATYDYSAYGEVTSQTGTDPNPFQYAGQYTDSESGLEYLRARYYDPRTGQMLTRDPLAADTRAPYGYASADPIDETDPAGLFSKMSVSNFAAG